MQNRNIENQVLNKLEFNKSLVWTLTEKSQFNYSDGKSSELYLDNVFSTAKDLSSSSFELERHVKDWPSEYHLTRKRAQLLSGFNFDRSKKVLEVGCGCGSITRFLGESFDDVIAIEGSIERAKLARKRTKNMENVQIICAPFQELGFSCKFDIIFCIGVFEYSNAYIQSEQPYDFMLNSLYKLLTDTGILVIAIENKFGLKYFSSSTDDHTHFMYDGIEGNPRFGNKVKTFGYDELKGLLLKRFIKTDFYFPYPDYKVPECIISEEFFKKAKVGELISAFKPRDYYVSRKPLIDETLTILEIDKNNKLPFFSNSFLTFSYKSYNNKIQPDWLGILYNSSRKSEFNTRTTFIEFENKLISQKTLLNESGSFTNDMIKLHSCQDSWIDSYSLHTEIYINVKRHDLSIEEMFLNSKKWFAEMMDNASNIGGAYFVNGKLFDCTWNNSFIIKNKCILIDQEWEWNESLPLNILVIRAIYLFFMDIRKCNSYLSPVLNNRSTYNLINKVTFKCFDIKLGIKDFFDFFKLERNSYQIISGKKFSNLNFLFRLFSKPNSNVKFSILRIQRIIVRIIRALLRGVSGVYDKIISQRDNKVL